MIHPTAVALAVALAFHIASALSFASTFTFAVAFSVALALQDAAADFCLLQGTTGLYCSWTDSPAHKSMFFFEWQPLAFGS